MDGTTLCPHCNTRFRIEREQLDAHQGMVRCGHCRQAFDARPGFVPDEPSPQLELPMPQQTEPQPEIAEEPAEGTVPEDEAAGGESAPQEQSGETAADAAESEEHTELDFSQPLVQQEETKPLVLQSPMKVEDEPEEEVEPVPAARRRWPWIAGSALMLLLLVAQALYFFRIEIAARLPGVKPLLVSYCEPLGCKVPLPQNAALMSIESSELEADKDHENLITLVAQLRNRAEHVQAFPILELTLNDTQDKALARRSFKPADYLPEGESEAAGLRSSREITIRLKLDTTELRPTGYRLALFYPQ